MKKFTLFCLLSLLLSAGLSAQRAILSFPVGSLREAFPGNDLRESVRLFSEAGYGVLHYDASQVIAISEDRQDPGIANTVFISEYPPRQHLYLVSDLREPSRSELQRVGSVVLEMDSGLILASDLEETSLDQRVDSRFIELSLEPMRISASRPLTPWQGEFRADVAQLVNSVCADSILAKIQHLQDFGTRHAYMDTRLPVAQWVEQQFQSYGISDTQLQEFSYNGYQQYNVIANLTGTEYPDQYIIIGGHHDSTSDDPYYLAPGADDNASGASAVLELARVMMQNNFQPKVSIRFMTFACEELGLKGSYNDAGLIYAADLDVRLMINFDMIGNNWHDPSEWMVRMNPYDGSLQYTDYAIGITEQYTTLDSYADEEWFNCSRSDSYPYWQKGYNIIYFFETDMDSSIYHTTNDNVDNLEIDYCTEIIKGAVACAAIFADLEEFSGVPVATPATSVGSESFIANWEAVPGATGYWLDVYQLLDNGPATDLFFSEYLEGSSSNRALEIFNGTGAEVDLSDYRVEYFSGWSSSPTYTLTLSGILADGETQVIAHPSSFPNILTRANVTSSSVTSFDGNDQLALKKLSTASYVDIIGRIGTDPGFYWGTGTLVTKDRTLVRKSTVTGGVTSNPASGFPTLATEWDSYYLNSYSRLGSHSLATISYLSGYENLSVGTATSCEVTGLAPGETYFYVVRADIGCGNFEASNQISVTTTIDSPVPVLTASETGITLGWPAVNGANLYRVEAADDPFGDYILLTTTPELQLEIEPGQPSQFFRVTAIH